MANENDAVLESKFRLLFEDDYIRVYFKPSLLHSVSQKNSVLSAVELYNRKYGSNPNIYRDENGLLYRLDNKTSGLLVFAKSDEYLKKILGTLVSKTYTAVCHSVNSQLKGLYDHGQYNVMRDKLDKDGKLQFNSYFRNYDLNSSFVRPVFESDLQHFSDKKITQSEYTTHIVKKSETEFVCTIAKGARHQIRSTLAALRYPIDGDIDYGSEVVTDDGSISLVCKKIEFDCFGKSYCLDLEKL